MAKNSSCELANPWVQSRTMKLVMKTELVIDHAATGTTARSAREARSLPLSIVADRMSVSRPYLCDLEAGRRQWTQEKLTAYAKAIGRNA